ncbi:SAM-dependent methyltransferase [Sphingomonas rhizophila]|uniref:SAM-dependent methyltransferase n=1 Tax=Sphingomonas rhizophila TaxID=2071607 RepID=A0A7G9SEQ7_9SPHN|nr:SAM-dependent methyltransferase [Sphingomonas rhizophila]QNN66332.1 SAM-dependent methyltransferase [Sphingomonas rhizophila]
MSSPPDLFDPATRLLRRRRALAIGDPFLFDRAVDDLAERLGSIARPLPRMLLIGALSPTWAERLGAPGRTVTTWEPAFDGDELEIPSGPFDAVVAVGSLATVDRLPHLLVRIRQALESDSPFLGTLIGGDSLPALRKALIAADQASGGSVAPRAHPRIDAPTLAALLDRSGFANPVVGVDRLNLRYGSLDRLVADLRAAAETNILAARSHRFAGKRWRDRLEEPLVASGAQGRFEERFELLHWIAWSPPILR